MSSEDTFTFCIEKGMHVSLKSKNGQLEISGEKRLYMLPYENSSFFFFFRKLIISFSIMKTANSVQIRKNFILILRSSHSMCCFSKNIKGMSLCK